MGRIKHYLELRKQRALQVLPTKLVPNGSKTLTLRAQGPRRTARNKGPRTVALGAWSVWIGLSNPNSSAVVPLGEPEQGTCVVLVGC